MNTIPSLVIVKNLRKWNKDFHIPAKTDTVKPMRTYALLLLTLSDVHNNPGPVRFPFKVCKKSIAKNHRAIACDNFYFWQHIKCIEITLKEYEELKHRSCVCICPICDQQNLSASLIDNQDENPFFHLTDHENPFLNFEDSLFDTEYDDLIDHMKTTEKEIHKSNRSKGKLNIMTVNCRSLKSKKKKESSMH